MRSLDQLIADVFEVPEGEFFPVSTEEWDAHRPIQEAFRGPFHFDALGLYVLWAGRKVRLPPDANQPQ